MLCPICKQEIKDDLKFCGKCGSRIPRCPTCNKVLTKRVRFCISDGTPIPDEINNLIPEEPVQTPPAVAEPPVPPAPPVPPVPPAPPVQKKFCVGCGGIVTDGSKYCPECQARMDGTRQPRKPEPAPRRFCVKCGQPCEADQTLCASCRTASGGKKPQKKKKGGAKVLLIILLVLLLLAGLGVGGSFLWTEVLSPEAGTVQEDTDRDEDEEDEKDQDSDSESDEDAAEETEAEETEEPTEVPTEEPTEAPTEAPTEPVITYEYRYEIYESDMSWIEAKEACEAKGGYLATITSQEEYEEISALAYESGLTYLWIGASLQSDDQEWSDGSWITGEEWTFENWYPGEPSREDSDGTKEYYLCLWKAKYKGDDIGWTFNDQRNDLVAAFDSVSGKVGYICEYKVEVVQ